MTDIVERLRLGGPNALEVTDEAADEIERLTAENDEFDEWITAQRKKLGLLRADNERLRNLVDAREADLGRMWGETGAEIERLTTDRDEWKQAAQVEAGLRREFLADNALLRAALQNHDRSDRHL